MPYSLAFDLLHHYDPALSSIDVPVVLSTLDKTIKTTAKLGTGASLCIFKREHGEALGLDIERGIPQSIGTATGAFTTYGHNLSIAGLGAQFDTMVFFAAEPVFVGMYLDAEASSSV